MKLKLSLSLTLIFLTLLSFAQVKVRGYYRSNGTYVQPHTRSSPDGNPYNNYSYPGNTNPYTGKVATGNPETYLKNHYNRSPTNSSSTYSGASNSLGNATYPASSSSDLSTNTTYPPSSSTSSYGTSSLSSSLEKLDRYTSTTNRMSIDHSTAILTSKKKYLKDSKGNYTGEYLKLTDEDDEMKKYKLYDANDFPKGTLITYSNGQRILFDNFGKVIARNKFKP